MFGPAASFFNVLPQLAPIAAPSIFDLPFCLTPIVGGRDVQNIEHNPSVEVNVVDPLVRKGYRFKGRGDVHRSDENFQRGCQMYRDKGLTIEIRAVVLIRVERAVPLRISRTPDDRRPKRQLFL